MAPLYSIIIPTYNHCDDLLRPCIDSITTYTDLTDVEIIIVANGCTDNTKEYVTNLNRPFKLIWFDQAIGYTKAINEGIKQAQGKYLILLNNDIEILPSEKNHWLIELKKPFSDPNVAITGPLTLYDHNVQSNFIVFCCAMIPKEIFDKFGLLDEIFNPGYGEDIDLTMRVKQQGYTIKCVNKTEFKNGTHVGYYPIYHKNNQTFKDIPEYSSTIVKRNQLILQERYKIQPIKLNLGCGNDYDPNYTNIDLYAENVDIRHDIKKLPYADNSIDEIKASHVIEHFDFFEGQEILKEWYRVLKPNSKIYIETPDFFTSCQEFINATEEERINLYGHFFSQPWIPGQTHKFLFTESQLITQLQWAGFKNIVRVAPTSNYIENYKTKLFLAVEAYK